MKRNLLFVIACVIAMVVNAQEGGIDFQHNLKWADAVAKAKAENKLIFVDFYTQWCGPCAAMAEEVFTLAPVGNYYNATFVNLKIDAENGEGVDLAKKYQVRSYPTYAFIDPATEEMVHRSGSRQTAERFIQTGKDAGIPTHRSFYLFEQYEKGNRERQFLMDYISYQNSVYNRKALMPAFDELIKGGAQLTEPEVWNTFVESINGMTPYLKQVSDNYADFCARFGKKAVDAKLEKETKFGDVEAIKALCDYEGKDFNLKNIAISQAVREKNYEKAAELIDAMIADPAVDQQKFIANLTFTARMYKAEEYPDFWFNKCLEYQRYIAYNKQPRTEAYVHYEYAQALEMAIKRMQAKGAQVPEALKGEPAHGKKVYDMRTLKPKPKRK